MNMKSDMFLKVGRFYSKSTITKFLEYIKRRHMHVGYWDDEHPFDGDLYEGAKRFTDYMISLTNIEKDQLFIDFGCGFGVPAITLAKRRNCRVIGITASSYQAEIANQKSLENNLGNKAIFIVGNAHTLLFSDNVFDSGWFFESIFHMDHHTALKEAHRVIKPGGSLLIADFIITGDMNETDLKFLKNELEIKSWTTMDEYPSLLDKSGFDLIELIDITDNTINKEKRWGAHLDIINNKKEALYQLTGKEGYEYLKSFFTQLHRIGKNTIEYCLVKARNKE